MVPAQVRIAHYIARMSSSLIDPVLSAMNALAVANFTSYVNEFVPKQEELAALMGTWTPAVPVVEIFGYHAFNNSMYRATRSLFGLMLAAEARALVTKYTALGLVKVNLEEVCTTIWGVTPTTP